MPVLDPIKQFERHHGIKIPTWWVNGKPIIRSIINARHELLECMAGAPVVTINSEPSLGIIYQLSERAAEQLFGAVVCFAAKSAPSAELSARACLENSVNVMFMLKGDRTSLSLAWVSYYLEQERKRIDAWEESVRALGPEERYDHTLRIESRRAYYKTLKSFIMAQASQMKAAGLSVDGSIEWPRKISKRFGGIGESAAYYTAYFRMSTQTHGDAEDTISYMLATLLDDENMKSRLGREAVAFSEYLVLFGALYYLRSIQRICDTYLHVRTTHIGQGEALLLNAMHELSRQWGW